MNHLQWKTFGMNLIARTPIRPAVVVLSAALSIPVPAWADSAKSLGKFGDWSSYVYVHKGEKVCYASSLPKRSLNAPAHRGEAYLTVTDRTSGHSVGVVSVSPGYTYKPKAVAEVDVDGDKFSLYTAEATAWANNDKAVVQAMLNGETILAYGTPENGRKSVDTYSLNGFAKAFAEVGRACGLK